MFYQELNLTYPNFSWIVVACKKNTFITPMDEKYENQKYPFWRLDCLVSKKKYIDVNFVLNGGWHFSNIKSKRTGF